MTCVQKQFLMADDERGIVVILLQKYDHYSSFIINHQKVFPYTNSTFHALITYKLFCIHRIISMPQKWRFTAYMANWFGTLIVTSQPVLSTVHGQSSYCKVTSLLCESAKCQKLTSTNSSYHILSQILGDQFWKKFLHS